MRENNYPDTKTHHDGRGKRFGILIKEIFTTPIPESLRKTNHDGIGQILFWIFIGGPGILFGGGFLLCLIVFSISSC